MVCGVRAMVGDTLVVGAPEALDACLSGLFAASFVFVVGGGVADALAEPDVVVVAAHPLGYPPESWRHRL